MKTLFLNRSLIVLIFGVMLLIYGVQGVSYGQGTAPTVTPGENNTSLVVRFSDFFNIREQKAHQIQFRRKSPQGEWITICQSTTNTTRRSCGLFFFCDAPATLTLSGIFTDLEPGTTYEARYRDTNVSECTENPPHPDLWSDIGGGSTHLVPPPRVEFIDANLARQVRYRLGLDTKGGHIDLLKIPQASLTKLTELESDDKEITDLTGLEHATQLTDLDLSDNQISDITPLAQLTQLIYLELDRNQISDITPLAQLTQLTDLDLSDNQIRDISPLAGLPILESLSLSSNQISDVTLLTTFGSVDSLRYLYLTGNPITDISPIRTLKREYPNLSISIDIPVILTDPGGEPDLYVIADGAIFQLNLNEINAEKISPQSLRTYDIAIDVIGDKIYWASRDNIQRANLDGTNVQDVITGLDEPENIAVDVSGGQIYWTIERGDRIQRANLDGTNVQDVVTGLYRPYGIAVDISGDRIYWMEEDDHRIRRANLDGTNVQDVITGLDEPEDITLDVSGGQIYWIEGGSRQIQRANLDGSDAHIVVTDLDGAPRGIALDIAGNRIYWTDLFYDEIWRANLDGSDVQLVAIGVSIPTAIALSISQPRGTITITFNPSTIADQTFTVGTSASLNLPIATGGTEPYTYTLSPPLPAGLRFDAVNRSIGGTPTTATPQTRFTYTATDANGASASLNFTIEVTGTGPGPGPDPLDVNGDGQVDVLDLVLVAVFYGTRGNGLPADVNADGIVNVQDFAAVAAGVDAANALPVEAIEAALLVAAEQAAALEAGAGAPVGFGDPPRVVRSVNTAYGNIAEALVETSHLAATDARLTEAVALLETLLSLLAEMRAIPETTALLPNYPNPFNPETWIPYHLAKPTDVTMRIYAMNGTLVRTLALGHQAAGMYQSRSRAAYWDGRNALGESVASGIYFYTLTAGDFTATRKMLIRK